MVTSDPPEWAGFLGYVFFCLFGILVFVHGLASFCAGLTAPNASLSQLAYSVVVCCVVMVQFYIIGYTIEFGGLSSDSDTSWYGFTGDLSQMFLRNIDYLDPTAMGKVLLLYGFSVVPACLLASAACQRGRFLPLLVFVSVWMTVVYCPVAHWCWHPDGWSRRLGVLDYAGGTIIHITAGFGGLVYSLVLGPRMSYASGQQELPSSLAFVISGTAQMLLGWIGFTGASQTSDPGSAFLGVFNTILSAAAGGICWTALDSYAGYRATESAKFSLVSFCSGVVSGLVAITPGAGYIPPGGALLMGLVGGLGCNLSTQIKFYLGIDDPLDVFAVHGIGGLIGTLLTGLLAFSDVRRPNQFGLQLLSGLTTAGYTLGLTLVIAVAVDSVPMLALRVDAETEQSLGIDMGEHGEGAPLLPLGPDEVHPVSTRRVPTRANGADLSRLRQGDVNVSMQLGTFDQPLLQRLPLSYGTYSHQTEDV